MLKLNLVQTLAFAAVVLYLGYLMRRFVPLLGRYNLPAPVLGGLLVALIVSIARYWEITFVEFDQTLRDPLMVAFFTTIGFGASVPLLKRGGPLVIGLLVFSTLVAVLQNIVGAGAAIAMGQDPLFGVMVGSLTLTGGPATGLAFAPAFEAAGISGAEAIAIAAAMGGIICAGIIGTPIGTLLIERLHRPQINSQRTGDTAPPVAAQIVEQYLPAPSEQPPAGEDAKSYSLIKSLGFILVAMWIGGWISIGLTSVGFKLPAQIGAMLVAAVMRNIDDLTGWLGLSQSALDDLGNTALAFFLAIALMSLDLWTLQAVAAPLLVILFLQVVMVAALCAWPVFPWMGRDYDAAVTASGFAGYMIGTTANAMANMDALARRYGPAPRAFLVVPMVGAFFIDFTNAWLIQACLNWMA